MTLTKIDSNIFLKGKLEPVVSILSNECHGNLKENCCQSFFIIITYLRKKENSLQQWTLCPLILFPRIIKIDT